MTKLGIDRYRMKLLALRERFVEDASQLKEEGLRTGGAEASGNLSHVPIHMADLGTDSFEQEFTLNLLENDQQRLKEIDAALERIAQGTFGRCEECEKVITKERLEALLYARHCIECARKHE
jgi:DnaK suppressor protein